MERAPGGTGRAWGVSKRDALKRQPARLPRTFACGWKKGSGKDARASLAAAACALAAAAGDAHADADAPPRGAEQSKAHARERSSATRMALLLHLLQTARRGARRDNWALGAGAGVRYQRVRWALAPSRGATARHGRRARAGAQRASPVHFQQHVHTKVHKSF